MNENAEAQGEPIAADCDILPPEPQKAPESALNAGNGQFCAAWSPERAQAKEAIKMAFVSGKTTLAALAVQFAVPYDTILRWSASEKWGHLKEQICSNRDIELAENVANRLQKEREKQIFRSLVRSEKLQTLADEAVEVARSSEDGLTPAAVQALACAEEKADLIARRNLGMEDKGGNHTSFNVNFIGGANFG